MNEYRILAAVDPMDDCARDVALVAGNLASRTGGRVILLTVLPDRHDRDRLNRTWPLLEGLAKLMGGAEPPEIRVGHGPAVPGILAAADKEGAELIVIGTHGRRGLERVVLGSVAEEVIRVAVPVVATVRVS